MLVQLFFWKSIPLLVKLQFDQDWCSDLLIRSLSSQLVLASCGDTLPPQTAPSYLPCRIIFVQRHTQPDVV